MEPESLLQNPSSPDPKLEEKDVPHPEISLSSDLRESIKAYVNALMKEKEEKKEKKEKEEKEEKKTDPVKENFKKEAADALNKELAEKTIDENKKIDPVPEKKMWESWKDKLNDQTLSFEEVRNLYRSLRQNMKAQHLPFKVRSRFGLLVREFFWPPWNVFRSRSPHPWRNISLKLLEKWEKQEEKSLSSLKSEESF